MSDTWFVDYPTEYDKLADIATITESTNTSLAYCYPDGRWTKLTGKGMQRMDIGTSIVLRRQVA